MGEQPSVRRRLRLGRGVRDETNEEIRLHLEQRVEQLIARGHSPESARAEAERQFGAMEDVHQVAVERERKMRLRGWLDSFKLDLKLGGRMLVKYPGLTVVGGLAMAFAIWVGTVVFEMMSLVVFPTVPLPQGERLVQIEIQDVEANGSEGRALHDFLTWRGALRSVSDVGAWRDASLNLSVSGGQARPVVVAEITASAFRVSDANPLLGRVLTDADEAGGAPPVAVLGYEVWRSRFESDPEVVGRTVQLGTEAVTVVGVMREAYAFPVSHEVWTPLKAAELDRGPRAGPQVTIFGLLAPGRTLEEAQAELTGLGQRAAAELPATHAHLQPRVEKYTNVFMGEPSKQDLLFVYSIYLFPLMLLGLVCGNVALLLFARAATRENDLLVRTALGGGRSRIIAQLFAEALVLGGVAAVIGLVAAHIALGSLGVAFLRQNLGRLPFWFDPHLSPSTVLAATLLTVLGAGIAGILPALKVTRGMATQLRESAAGGGGLQFGGVWTAVIVVQVAVTVAFPALVYVENWQLTRARSFESGFADQEFLAATISMDAAVQPGANPDSMRLLQRASLAEEVELLRERMASEPEVAGFTFVDRLPRTAHQESTIEVLGQSAEGAQQPGEPDGNARAPLREVSIAAVDRSYFDVLGAPVLEGRTFDSGDLTAEVPVAIVDQAFVENVLQGRDAIGQHFRFSDEARTQTSNWFEIVGVVKELGMGNPGGTGPRPAGVYFPFPLNRFDAINVLVHVRGDPLVFAQRFREIAAAVDPSLELTDIQRADEVTDGLEWVIGFWLRLTMLLTGVALLLSLAGIYAVLSFTVSRRTREIGVRVALGASRNRVLAAVFRRPLTQMGLGIVAGSALILGGALLAPTTEFPGADQLANGLSFTQVGMLLAHATFMLGVCLLACVVPTRRALAIEPTLALRTD
jgi:putative ABC transport system permease protein